MIDTKAVAGMNRAAARTSGIARRTSNRLTSRAGLLLPTVATVALRSNQFLVLVLLLRIPTTTNGSFLVAAVGTITALTIASDIGSAAYILARPQRRIGRSEYTAAVLFGLATSCVGLVAALAIIAARASDDLLAEVWMLILALGVAQLIDNSLRTVRAPLLLEGRDVRYSTPELLLAALKLPVIGTAFLTANLNWLLVLPVLSLSVIAPAFVSIRRARHPAPIRRVRVVGEITQFGVAGSLSALYSQAPLIIGAIWLPIQDVAMLTVAYRFVQPLEILPATLATQLVPRVRSRVRRPWRWWAAFCSIGASLAATALLSADLLRDLTQIENWAPLTFAIVAVALIPKAGNYALAAIVMGNGLIKSRLMVTALVGLTAIALSVAMAVSIGLTGVALVTPASEILLLLGLGLVLAQSRRKEKDNEGIGHIG